MGLLDVVMGKAVSVDDAEEALGRPDQAEAHDLALHVDRCGKRWALSYRASRNNSAQLAQIRLILALLAGYLILNSPPLQKLLQTLLQ